jgi:hypothetical protein
VFVPAYVYPAAPRLLVPIEEDRVPRHSARWRIVVAEELEEILPAS